MSFSFKCLFCLQTFIATIFSHSFSNSRKYFIREIDEKTYQCYLKRVQRLCHQVRFCQLFQHLRSFAKQYVPEIIRTPPIYYLIFIKSEILCSSDQLHLYEHFVILFLHRIYIKVSFRFTVFT